MHLDHPEWCNQKLLVLMLVFWPDDSKMCRCFPWINVISSASDSSSEVELYLSSLNRGADDRELEVGDAGRGIQGVKGRCGPSISAVVSVLSAEATSGN